VELDARDGNRSLAVALDVTAAGRRTYRVNGSVRRKLSGVTGNLPAVVFTPDDLRIVKDSAERRRSTIDDLGVQLSPAYGVVRTEYERVVRQRNALLRQGDVGEEELAPWTERLVASGVKLGMHRARLFGRVSEAMAKIYRALAEEEVLSATYVAAWAGELNPATASAESLHKAMGEHLAANESAERAKVMTLTGPHRDDVAIEISHRDARAFASQGQQRTAALAWKLAEVQVTEGVTGATPVLLLDDVMSELDEKRRHALMGFVSERVQTFISTTNLGYFEKKFTDAATVVRL
ncbi:MAG: DNA replication and repair protein RecF, partial [Actinomycetota bacterium]|nr:DNA replication and repair protein RecF [Actinomycetota bacterium]